MLCQYNSTTEPMLTSVVDFEQVYMTVLKINQGKWFSLANVGVVSEDTQIQNLSTSPVFQMSVEDTPTLDNMGYIQRDTKGRLWFNQIEYDADFSKPCLDLQLNKAATGTVGNPTIISCLVDLTNLENTSPFLSTESYTGTNILREYSIYFTKLKEDSVYKNYIVNDSKSIFCQVPDKFKFEMVSVLNNTLPSSTTAFVHDHEIKINGFGIGTIPWVDIQEHPTHVRIKDIANASISISEFSTYRYIELTDSPRTRVKITKEDETENTVTLSAQIMPDYETKHAKIVLTLRGNPQGSINTGMFDKLDYISCFQDAEKMAQRLYFKDSNGYGVICNASLQQLNITQEPLGVEDEFFNFFDVHSTSDRIISAGTNCDTVIVLDFPEIHDIDLVRGFNFISDENLTYIKADLLIDDELIVEHEFNNIGRQGYHLFDTELKIDNFKITLDVLETDINQYAAISEGVLGKLTYVDCLSAPGNNLSENIVFTDGVDNYNCTVTMDSRENGTNDDFAPHNLFAPADKRTSEFSDISSGADTLKYTIEFNDPIMLANILTLKIDAGSQESLARQVRYTLFDSSNNELYTERKVNTTFNHDYEMIFDVNPYTSDISMFSATGGIAVAQPSYYYKIVITTPEVGVDEYVNISDLEFEHLTYDGCINEYKDNTSKATSETVGFLNGTEEFTASVSLPILNKISRILTQPEYYFKYVITSPFIDDNVCFENLKFNGLDYDKCVTKYSTSNAPAVAETVNLKNSNVNYAALVSLTIYNAVDRILNQPPGIKVVLYNLPDNFCFRFDMMTVSLNGVNSTRTGSADITPNINAYINYKQSSYNFQVYYYVYPNKIHSNRGSLSGAYMYETNMSASDTIKLDGLIRGSVVRIPANTLTSSGATKYIGVRQLIGNTVISDKKVDASNIQITVGA